MKILLLQILIILTLCIYSCSKEEQIPEPTLIDISGSVQKGPFLNGTSIMISVLDSNLIQTGKVFNSQIFDNNGNFEINGIEISSNYIELKADGFYFNEIKNESSASQLTLYTLADITNNKTLNVNVLSNLEKRRVEYLISEGAGFYEAKKQAQSEILKIFEINEPDISESEKLDITKTGEGNATLLAVSAILQGYLTVPELSELLANLSSDLHEDGELNDEALGEILIKNAKTLKTEEIRKNLESKYESLGNGISVPNFEKYVNQFIDSTDFKIPGLIEYPENGSYGSNLLYKDKTEYSPGVYSLCAVLSEGTLLKVKIQGRGWYYPVSQDWSGWVKSKWDSEDNSRTFTAKKTGLIDLLIELSSESLPNTIKIYICENNEIEPSWIKEINIK